MAENKTNMIEALFDKTVQYLFPKMCSEILATMDDLQAAQDPPYSKGMIQIEIHRHFTQRKWSSRYLFWSTCEPVLTNMARYDYIYINEDCNKYSRVRLEGYLTCSENIAKRYPGYILDKETQFLLPVTDNKVNLDEWFALMRSKDLSKYEREKDKFFGPSGRYTTENA